MSLFSSHFVSWKNPPIVDVFPQYEGISKLFLGTIPFSINSLQPVGGEVVLCRWMQGGPFFLGSKDVDTNCESCEFELRPAIL